MSDRQWNFCRRFTRGSIFIFSALFFVQTGLGASAPQPVAEWTIMVFMNAKNNLEGDAIPNFNQIAGVGSSDKVNLLVELGRPKKHYVTIADSGWSGVRRYKIEKDDSIDRLPDLDLGDSTATADMGDPKSLSDFLDWGFTNYKANHYLLVIWNHGQGWRFEMAGNRALREGSLNRSQSTEALISQNAGHLPAVVGGFRAVSSDEDTGHILFNRQIEDTLLAFKGQGKNLDIVGFDACLMGMLETAYALRDVATYMVGSEELEPGPGWRYDKWLTPLITRPTMSAADLAAQLVAAYESVYGDFSQTTLSAVDLGRVPAAADALGAFSTALTAKLEAQRATIGIARSKLFAFGSWYGVKGNGSIDLQTFLSQFASATADADLKKLSISAQNAVHAAIAINYASKQEKRYSPKGLAFYMPPTPADFSADPDSNGYLKSNTDHVVQFVHDYDWATVVAQYLHVGP